MTWLILLAIGVALFLLFNGIAARKHKREREARPRITAEEVQAVFDLMEAERLPLVRLRPDTDRVPAPLETRLGGAPWTEAGSDWPMDDSGSPYLFLAQINFSDIPPLPDFPEEGLLQVFVAWEGGGLVGGDDGGEKSHKLRWYPNPAGGALLPIPPAHLKPKSQPFNTDIAREKGLALRFEADELPATPYALPVEAAWPNDFERLAENEDVEEMLGRIETMGDELVEKYGPHRIGGHPTFVQDDPRHDPALKDMDRVLLHLGFDDHVCIGDAGEINLMIRSGDLAARRFEKAFYYWDCS